MTHGEDRPPCEHIDEIANLADQAVAAQAYYQQSQDVENEMHASRIRVRAERQLGVILKRMAQNGERRGPGDPDTSRGATSLNGLGIPRDRASRAMQRADVPEEEFETALSRPGVAQPRRILDERKPATALPQQQRLLPRCYRSAPNQPDAAEQ